LVDLARYLGLDTETFADDLDHPDTQAELAGQIALTQAYGVKGFPTLLLETSDNRTFIDINPNDSQGILNQMGAG
jgi:predicted DsbA family dithiol-disulfide isomerase